VLNRGTHNVGVGGAMNMHVKAVDRTDAGASHRDSLDRQRHLIACRIRHVIARTRLPALL
jgi:hypothetical protein